MTITLGHNSGNWLPDSDNGGPGSVHALPIWKMCDGQGGKGEGCFDFPLSDIIPPMFHTHLPSFYS